MVTADVTVVVEGAVVVVDGTVVGVVGSSSLFSAVSSELEELAAVVVVVAVIGLGSGMRLI